MCPNLKSAAFRIPILPVHSLDGRVEAQLLPVDLRRAGLPGGALRPRRRPRCHRGRAQGLSQAPQGAAAPHSQVWTQIQLLNYCQLR